MNKLMYNFILFLTIALFSNAIIAFPENINNEDKTNTILSIVCPSSITAAAAVCTQDRVGNSSCSQQFTLCFDRTIDVPAIGDPVTINGISSTVNSVNELCVTVSIVYSSGAAPSEPFTVDGCIPTVPCPTSIVAEPAICTQDRIGGSSCSQQFTLCYSQLSDVPAIGETVTINGISNTVNSVNGLCITVTLVYLPTEAPSAPFTVDDCIPSPSNPICPDSIESINSESCIDLPKGPVCSRQLRLCYSQESDMPAVGDDVTINGLTQPITSIDGLCAILTISYTPEEQPTLPFTVDNCVATSPCPESVTENADGSLTFCFADGKDLTGLSSSTINGTLATFISQDGNCMTYIPKTTTTAPYALNDCDAISPTTSTPCPASVTSIDSSCAISETSVSNCTNTLELCFNKTADVPAVGESITINGITDVVSSINGLCATIILNYTSDAAPTAPFTVDNCTETEPCPEGVTENIDGTLTFCYTVGTLLPAPKSTTINGVTAGVVSQTQECVTYSTGEAVAAPYALGECDPISPSTCATSACSNEDGSFQICYNKTEDLPQVGDSAGIVLDNGAKATCEVASIDGLCVTLNSCAYKTTHTEVATAIAVDGCDPIELFTCATTSCPESVIENTDGTLTFCYTVGTLLPAPKSTTINGITADVVSQTQECVTYSTGEVVAAPYALGDCDPINPSTCAVSACSNETSDFTICYNSIEDLPKVGDGISVVLDNGAKGVCQIASIDGLCITLNSCAFKSAGVGIATNVKVHGCDPIELIDCSELPVELFSFTGLYHEQRHEVVVKWETLSELNIDFYQLERSFDGQRYEAIHRVFDIENSNDLNEYNYIDNLDNTIIKNAYYRLKTVDLDGTFEYSNIIPVEITRKNTEIQVYPIPVRGEAMIEIEAKGTIIIRDMFGRVVAQQVKSDKSTNVTINLSHLPSGNYFVQFLNPNGLNLSTKKITVFAN